MLSTQRFKILTLITALAFLAVAATAQEPEKKRKKKWMMVEDDPFVMFVPGQPLLVAAERGGSALLLRVPELDIVRKLDGVSDLKLEFLKSSQDEAWLLGFFEASRGSAGGALRVWSTATGESRLLLEHASRSFAFGPAEKRLIVWQPPGGITQWTVGEFKQVGPVTPLVRSVAWMRVSKDGRYVLIAGSCSANDKFWSYCVYSLEDGSPVGWTSIVSHDIAPVAPNVVADAREFDELLVATKLEKPPEKAETSFGACKDQGSRVLCRNPARVDLAQPDPPPSSGTTVLPRRHTLWSLRAHDVGARYINSCALSTDGRWLAISADGKDVMLFDTQQLEAKSQPAPVKKFEMP